MWIPGLPTIRPEIRARTDSHIRGQGVAQPTEAENPLFVLVWGSWQRNWTPLEWNCGQSTKWPIFRTPKFWKWAPATEADLPEEVVALDAFRKAGSPEAHA